MVGMMTARYPRSMADLSMTQAVARGIRRGVRIAINPNTDHLRELQAKSLEQDHLAQAWIDVGQALRDSMSAPGSRVSR
jgi:hypothetical protein